MTNTLKNEDLECIKKNIIKLYFSYVVLFISAILFWFCFIFENVLFLYVILTILFLLFVILYMSSMKKLTHQSGYTYVQSIDFYKSINKNIDTYQDISTCMIHISKDKDYCESLDKEQLQELYSIGEALFSYMKKSK